MSFDPPGASALRTLLSRTSSCSAPRAQSTEWPTHRRRWMPGKRPKRVPELGWVGRKSQVAPAFSFRKERNPHPSIWIQKIRFPGAGPRNPPSQISWSQHLVCSQAVVANWMGSTNLLHDTLAKSVTQTSRAPLQSGFLLQRLL